MKTPSRLVLATRNPGKVGEFRHATADLGLTLLTPGDFPDAPEVDEDRDTLAGNAEKKARSLFDHTGLPSLADDTGLEVDALGGRPGVYSARYAGEDCTPADNRAKMLAELDGVTSRSARFRTVLAYIDESGTSYTFDGVCEGTILTEERGDGGFGYDAIFQPAGYTETFAELSKDEKNRISHRGKAVARFVTWLTADSS
ncbi:MAG: RdgB/HAM1 family non-canonical purine NTP pyrophosphatase [Bacteroidota bacterium]